MEEPVSSKDMQRAPVSRRFFSPWGGLPDFCALVPVVWCLSFAVTGFVVGANVGRQSSTSGIVGFLAIIEAPLLGAVGLVLGKLLAHVLRSRVPQRVARRMKWCAPLLLVAVGFAGARHASAPIHAAERAALPRVIVNSARMHKINADLRAVSLTRAVRVQDHLGKVNLPLQWEDRSVYLMDLGKTLEVRLSSPDKSLFIPLPGIDYINFIDAVPLRMGSTASPALALLITGRATGRRDLVAVVSESGQLVYLELLDRFWNYATVPFAITSSAAGDLLVVGSEPRNLLVFSPQAGMP